MSSVVEVSSVAEANAERDRMQAGFGLPVCDVYRDGASDFADAVMELKLSKTVSSVH